MLQRWLGSDGAVQRVRNGIGLSLSRRTKNVDISDLGDRYRALSHSFLHHPSRILLCKSNTVSRFGTVPETYIL